MKFLKVLEFYEIFEIFEIVQYTYSVQIQGYIARFFSIEINREIFITILKRDKLKKLTTSCQASG
jgi:hypothetical protein